MDQRKQVLFLLVLLSIALMLLSRPVEATQDPASAPTVEIKAVLAHDGLQRGEASDLFVIIANNSATPIRILKLTLIKGTLESVGEPDPVLSTVAGFETVHTSWRARPVRRAAFGQHTALVSLEYSWGSGIQGAVSHQAATLQVKVKRAYEDELGGVVGGGAAALYLLLPVILLIAAYQVVEGLQDKEKNVAWPEFGTKYIIPAAVGSIFFNAALRWLLFPVLPAGFGDDLLEPRVFLPILALSCMLGAFVPAAKFASRTIRELLNLAPRPPSRATIPMVPRTSHAEINAPVNVVFAYISDLERHSDWGRDSQTIRADSREEIAVGKTFKSVVRGPKGEVEYNLRVTELVLNERFAFEASGNDAVCIHTFAVKPVAASTQISTRISKSARFRTISFVKIPFVLFLVLLLLPMRLRGDLNRIKKELENTGQLAGGGEGAQAAHGVG